MPRDPRVEKLQRLRYERSTRANGRYYGTRATAQGNVLGGPRKRDMGRTLLSLVVFVVIIVGGLFAAGQFVLHGIRPAAAAQTRTVVVTVAPGESVAHLATRLQNDGLIVNATLFHWYIRLAGIGGNIQAGPHVLRTNMSMDEVVQALSTAPPPVPTANVTILPGWRAEQVAAALDSQHVARYADVMQEVRYGRFPTSRYPFLADRPTGATLEGYLLPDTYTFRLHEGAHNALARILSDFGQQVTPQLRDQGKKLYGSFYNALIMASIVEREAGTAHDRYLIASVYTNRLHDTTGAFRFLNADPTIQYAVGHAPDWWPLLTRHDLHVNSPFNTYHVRHGLPPAPIAEPSLDSIKAAVGPVHTNYFYFYHINGSHGKSIFCTAAEGATCQSSPQ